MIRTTIAWSLRNRLFVVAVSLLLLLWGGWEAVRMPVDVFPDLTAPSVTVVAESHGMAPEDMETQVTFPIETALNGAPGVRRVRSTTKSGIATVVVEFEWGTDVLVARQVVAEKLQLARASLPPDVPLPVIAPAASIMGEIMFIALVSDRHDATEIKRTADFVLRRRILAEPGVAEVIPIGGDVRQYEVVLRPERLAAYGVTVDEVIRAVRETNQNAPAGFYVEGGQQLLIQGVGRVRTLEDIGETVVAQREGNPVLVRNLAEVRLGTAFKVGDAAANGRPAVVLGIQKQPNVNTLDLTARLDRTLGELQGGLPAGMKLETRIFRQADFIQTAIDNLLAAIRDGALLVVAIVFGFLWSGRATLITLTAIPLSVLAAILALKALGGTLNTMTLGGLAIALGALVDDAIIVVENIVRRLREHRMNETGEPVHPMRVVFDATREIQGSIVFATLIIMLVFLPLFFLSGVEGRLMVPLGLAYVVALAASLLVAITVTPVLSSFLLPGSATVAAGHEPAWVERLKAAYGRLLDATVLRWRAVGALALLLFAGAVAASLVAGRAFLPDFNEGALTVSASTLPGTSLEESDRLGRMVEAVLLSHPEVVATARRTGRSPLDPHALNIQDSEIEVGLRLKRRTKEAFLGALRADLEQIPGMSIVVGQPISHRIDHMLSGSRANIAVKLFGPDLHELRRLSEEAKAVVAEVPGAVDVVAEQQTDVPLLTVRFDRAALARYGLTVAGASEAIEAAFAGVAASKVLEGQSAYDLVVRYDPAVRDSLDAIRSALITTASGARLPLSALAEIRRDLGPNQISRENVQRKIVVTANVAGRDLAGVVEDIQTRMARAVRLPPGYHVAYGGQFESAQEAVRTLLLLGVAVTAGMFLLLYVAFRSARDAILVMLNLPLALIGGIAGVFAAGGVISVASIIGLITLFGIATRNGVMMVAHFHHLVEHEGVSNVIEAVKRGARERLVPILMTALAAGFALVPLALASGEPGSEIQAPMAIVILFGLLSSTALNMVVLPALYLRFGVLRRDVRFHHTRRRRETDYLG